MYRPRSFYGELGDVEILEHDGRLHLFHLTIPNRDLVQHVVSDDGLSWQALPPAIHTGKPGDCDDDMIRTMSVTERDGVFYMLYTATSRAEGGRVERTALATSTDLVNWCKHPANPVAQPGDPLYESALDGRMFTSWRDPKPYFENGVYYCLNCARQAEGPFLRRGSVQLMTSEDLIHWQVRAPLFAPRQHFDVECPQLYKIGAHYYILGAVMEEQTQRYWVSDRIDGEYRSLPNNLLMPDHSHYAGRLAQFKGNTVYCCWNSVIQDGPSPFDGLLAHEGEPMRYVPSLLELRQAKDGRLWLAPYAQAWRTYQAGPTQACERLQAQLLCKNPAAQYGDVTLSVRSGFDVAALTQASDFLLEAEISVDAARAGIAFCLNDEAEGYFLEFSPAEYRVRLIQYLRIARKGTGSPWFHYEVRQQNVLPPSASERDMQIRLLYVHGEIECAIDGKVVISTVSTARTGGKLGVFAECGSIQAKSFRCTPMSQPGNR